MKVYCSKKGYFYKEYKNGNKVRISKDKYLKFQKSKTKQKGGSDYPIGNEEDFRLFTGYSTLGISSLASLATNYAEQEDYIYLVNDTNKRIYIKDITFPNNKKVTKIKKLVSNGTTQLALNNSRIMTVLKSKGEELYFRNLKNIMNDKVWYLNRFYNVRVQFDKNYINENNFMEYKCSVIDNYSMLPIQNNFHILNKDFYKNYSIYFDTNNPETINLFKFTEYKFKKVLNIYNTRKDLKPFYDNRMGYCFILTNIQKKYSYKIHISFNPEYLNEALIKLFRSDFYKYIKKIKVFYPLWIHYYKSTSEYNIWNEIKDRNPALFYCGIGFFVIYFESNDIRYLKQFIEYWKNVFENDDNKYRDENYLKFNERLSKTLYFGKGGDTSSKISNQKERKSTTTQKALYLSNKFSKLIKSNPENTKQTLKNTYSIDYNKEALNNFDYWCDKNTSCNDILKQYDIATYEN